MTDPIDIPVLWTPSTQAGAALRVTITPEIQSQILAPLVARLEALEAWAKQFPTMAGHIDQSGRVAFTAPVDAGPAVPGVAIPSDSMGEFMSQMYANPPADDAESTDEQISRLKAEVERLTRERDARKVKLPEKVNDENGSLIWAGGYNRGITECAIAMRAAGVEVE